MNLCAKHAYNTGSSNKAYYRFTSNYDLSQINGVADKIITTVKPNQQIHSSAKKKKKKSHRQTP